MVAGIKSERWPTSNRNPRPDCLGIRTAASGFQDLELKRALGDAIVVADLQLLPEAQDLIEVDAENGGEGRPLAGRIDGETRVVGSR
jgi:hypothetical protein